MRAFLMRFFNFVRLSMDSFNVVLFGIWFSLSEAVTAIFSTVEYTKDASRWYREVGPTTPGEKGGG